MITLYDLVFQDDRRPSPFCWRAKFALKHKGLAWRDEPVGFTEKQKIAFAQSQTVPVIHDGPKVVKDSWAIAQHLDERLSGEAAVRAGATSRPFRRLVGRHRRASGAVPDPCRRSLRLACGRSISPISSNSRGKRLGTTDFAGFQAKAREKGVASLPRGAGAGAARAEGAAVPQRRAARLSRLRAGRRLPVGPRRHARSRCSKPTIRSTPGASACSTCSTAWAARAKAA